MLNYRNVNGFFLVLIAVWLFLDYQYHLPPSTGGWILLAYVSLLFCGSYFIQLGFFFKPVCSGDPGKREIALSFDDGPDDRTEEILEILERNEVQSTFFCIGKKIPGREEVLQRIADGGHLIGNHSYSHHPLFDLFSAERMLEDLEQMNEITEAVTGHVPRFFRPPYGVTNPNLRKAVGRGGFIAIGWNVRSLDTVIRDEARLMRRVLWRVKPGSILLFHDTGAATTGLLERLIRELKQRGYGIVRLDKMLKLEPYA